MTQLQIIADKLPSTLSTTLWVVLTNCKQSGEAYLRYKGEFGCTLRAYALDSRQEFNRGMGLTTLLTECIIITTASESLQKLHEDVMQLNEQINPLTSNKELGWKI